jgi:hypothetical protein
MKVTPQEALEEAIYDNLSQKMGWLNDYVVVETLAALRPDLTQEQIGARLKIDQSTVSKSLKVVKTLNLSARNLIYDQIIKSEDKEGNQRAVLALGGLATGGTDDQAKIEAALRVVLDRQMTEPLVKKLVDWVRKGNSPESFPADGKLSGQKGSKQQRFDPNDPHAELWKGLPKNIQAHRTPKGYKVVWNLPEHDAPVAVYGAMNYLQYSAGPGEKPESRYHEALPGLIAKAKEAKAKKALQLNPAQSPFAKGGALTSPDSSNPTLTKGGQGGFVEKIEQAIGQKAGPEGAAVALFVWANLWKDFKSAANMLIKQFFRRFLKRAL